MLRFNRAHKALLAFVVIFGIYYHMTPYDSRVRSFFRFQHNVVEDYVQETYPSDSWLFDAPQYPVDPVQDFGIIIKTGYGTRDRVPGTLHALGNQSLFADTIITQDFPVTKGHKNDNKLGNKEVPTIDIVGWNIERGAMNSTEHLERMQKYQTLAGAVESEEWQLADGLGKENGWELDALKFLPSLEYAWLNMPRKKWYIMLDDDTYIIKPSLSLLLSHLDPSVPQLLGNPVGDYKGRFPHGGSSVIISSAAMGKLYDEHPEIVAEGNLESPTETWGDKLLSTTFMKIGVYLDETFRRFFNGESPEMTRMWVDRFCIPLVSFHGLSKGDAMEQVGLTFANLSEPVFWRELGVMYGAPNFASFRYDPIRINMEFVGRLDEFSTTVDNVASTEHCRDICLKKNPNRCLAWSYDPASQVCHHAPWAIIGDYAENRASGVNAELAEKAASKCHAPPALPDSPEP